MSQAEHAEFEAEGLLGPGLKAMLASGEIDEPVSQGTFLALFNLVARLKFRRESLGMDLRQVADRSGLNLRFLIRLEGGWENNPPLDHLYRYALALDLLITLGVEEVEPPADA